MPKENLSKVVEMYRSEMKKNPKKKDPNRSPAETETYPAIEGEVEITFEAPESVDDLIKFYKEQGYSDEMAVRQAEKDMNIEPKAEDESTRESDLFRRVSQMIREMQMKGRI